MQYAREQTGKLIVSGDVLYPDALIFLVNMYKLYVRPYLEYCMSVWNPQYRGDVLKMEKVQNKMSKLLVNGERMNHEERNRSLIISSHEQRRARGDLINTFKVLIVP